MRPTGSMSYSPKLGNSTMPRISIMQAVENKATWGTSTASRPLSMRFRRLSFGVNQAVLHSRICSNNLMRR